MGPDIPVYEILLTWKSVFVYVYRHTCQIV